MTARSAHLLVAVDGSPAAVAAVRIAGRLGRALKAQVAVVHVSPPGLEKHVAEAPERLARDALAATGVSAKVLPRGGDVVDEIVAAARAFGADLLVMGSRARSPVMGLLLGSVSQDVVARASCPVLLVRAGADTSRSPMRILLAIEGTHGSEPLLRITARLAQGIGASVTVVHVSYPLGEELERSLYHADATHGEQAVSAAVAHLQKKKVEATAMQLVARAGISRALAECADSIDAGLIVVGSHGAGRPGEPARADVSTSVFRRTTRPVLVTPETERPD